MNTEIMKIQIRNMVCQGTRKFVLMEIKKLGISIRAFESGEVELHNELTSDQKSELEYRLSKYGLSIAYVREAGNVNKNLARELVHATD